MHLDQARTETMLYIPQIRKQNYHLIDYKEQIHMYRGWIVCMSVRLQVYFISSHYLSQLARGYTSARRRKGVRKPIKHFKMVCLHVSETTTSIFHHFALFVTISKGIYLSQKQNRHEKALRKPIKHFKQIKS